MLGVCCVLGHRLSFPGSGRAGGLSADLVAGLRNWAVWQKFVEAYGECHIFLDTLCRGRKRGEEINSVAWEWVGTGKFP